uniref:Pentacotripeptide-repeat region of PRORP domain-containing protein n=1 Tax=Aegilops tauschii subsp. strangulata TaxID=200361 RepID=A0A453RLW1_AEGTS
SVSAAVLRRLGDRLGLRRLATLPDYAAGAEELPQHPTSKDAYFAAVNHLSTIVRRDFYLERTLNRLRLPSPFPPDLALRVIRAAAPSEPLHAARFLAWLRAKPNFSPSADHFDALLLPLARARLFTHLWTQASDMRALGLPLSPATFSAVISSYGHSRLAEQAVEVFNRLPHFGCPQTTEVYNALLDALCANGNFAGAYKLLRRMARKGVAPDRATFSTLVDAWCASGKLREAQAFLDDMSSRGFRPPVRGRDLLVDGLVRAGRLEEAKAFALRITKEGVLPDVATFNSLAQALCDAGDVEFAVGLLADASSRGMCPDISTYKSICGDRQGALQGRSFR